MLHDNNVKICLLKMSLWIAYYKKGNYKFSFKRKNILKPFRTIALVLPDIKLFFINNKNYYFRKTYYDIALGEKRELWILAYRSTEKPKEETFN